MKKKSEEMEDKNHLNASKPDPLFFFRSNDKKTTQSEKNENSNELFKYGNQDFIFKKMPKVSENNDSMDTKAKESAGSQDSEMIISIDSWRASKKKYKSKKVNRIPSQKNKVTVKKF
mmetsp:Transcript_10369/g.11826  ORF Transcript_10369/g.11826 Transcript_10369/m.11826 type:complete len:117 (+) Transcript_10369:231-581(+)|eukprot:CAMPEP_0205803450 /NCGR_PEP_ID=MMETSP0205-20121125/6104_1 /ASSEMBLY_ACC=CAM_ASM_000278 /TAXON_ID=36767 /ORGANISM="Euplotes focardii, Strain TN1" /LENGTH=116 /DNA_ID=CAMNT_0053071541 /DNA_START=340 /DNA_END=690 /DNA_ORIENTATION=+